MIEWGWGHDVDALATNVSSKSRTLTRNLADHREISLKGKYWLRAEGGAYLNGRKLREQISRRDILPGTVRIGRKQHDF